jgi:predicted aspartyl protease
MVPGFLSNYKQVDCVVDSGATLSVISTKAARQPNLRVTKIGGIKVVQTQGHILMNRVCDIKMKIGQIFKNI